MPKLEGFRAVKDGWHNATCSGMEYRNANRSDNPMLVVELALEGGQLVNHYCVVTVSGKQISWMCHAFGFPMIHRGSIPAIDLDDFIGKKVMAHSYQGMIDHLSPAHSDNLTLASDA